LLAGASLFASAFSPRAAPLPQAPSLPMLARLGSASLAPGRSASAAPSFGDNLFSEVDRMVEQMF
jgi:hypothetical protein